MKILKNAGIVIVFLTIPMWGTLSNAREPVTTLLITLAFTIAGIVLIASDGENSLVIKNLGVFIILAGVPGVINVLLYTNNTSMFAINLSAVFAGSIIYLSGYFQVLPFQKNLS